MARRPEGWKLTFNKQRGIYGVRWTKDGIRHHESTGCRDPVEAAKEAAEIYAAAISGRRREVAGRTGGRIEIDVLGAAWLADAENTLDPDTIGKCEQYVRAWSAFFGTLDRLTGPAIEDFWRARLRVVKRRTVIKQLYMLNVFLRWLRGAGYLEMVPAYEMPPRSATGTPAPGRRAVETVPLSEAEVERILAKLPELSDKARRGSRGAAGRWRVADRFRVAWETALRPATLDAIRAPDDYRKGAATLRIRDEEDKARFGREVPLSGHARAALDRCVSEIGLIFGPVNDHAAARYLRMAAKAARLPPEKADRIKPYDLRHARITMLVETTGNIVGTAFLAGHKAITTTNHYVHAHARAAADVLSAAAKGTHSGQRGRGSSRVGKGRKR